MCFLNNAYSKRLIQWQVISYWPFFMATANPTPVDSCQTCWLRRPGGEWAWFRSGQAGDQELGVQLKGQDFTYLQIPYFKILLKTVGSREKEFSGHDLWWFDFPKVRGSEDLPSSQDDGLLCSSTGWSSRQQATWSTRVDGISLLILLLAQLNPPIFISEMTCPLRIYS